LLTTNVVPVRESSAEIKARAEKEAAAMEAMLGDPAVKKTGAAPKAGAAAAAASGSPKEAEDPAKKSAARASRSAAGKKLAEEQRRAGTGIFAPLRLDEDLRALCGGKEVMARSDIMKAVWLYVRDNGLKSKKVPRTVELDEKMRKVFGEEVSEEEDADVVTLGGLAKGISKHVKRV